MRRWIVRLAILLALVAAAVVLRRTVFAPPPLEVQVAEVAPGRVEETVTNSRAGTVKARRRAQLSPEIGGRVVALPHREGSRVKAGEVVLQLDASVNSARTSLSRRELEAARAGREQSCTAAERAARERDRLSRLASQGIVSADQLDQAKTAAETAAAGCRAARAGVAQAEANIELSRRQEDLTVLRAPFDGVIADLSVEVGEYTTPAPPGVPVPPVIDILDPSTIYVGAPMDEVDSARIAVGQPVRVTVDSYRGRTFSGRVSRIAPYVLDREEQNRTVEIEVDLDAVPAEVRLLPGTSADVEVILEAMEGILRLPTASLLEGNKVLLVGTDGVLTERAVETGLRNWDFTEVRGGLSRGDRVVVSLDRTEVKPGAHVRPVRPAPSGAPAKSAP